MKKRNILLFSAIAAASITMAGCGASSSTASSAASSMSAVPASSHVAEEGVTEPINMLTWTLDDLDDPETITFVPASIPSGVQDGSLTANVFSYDIYKKDEVENSLLHVLRSFASPCGSRCGSAPPPAPVWGNYKRKI